RQAGRRRSLQKLPPGELPGLDCTRLLQWRHEILQGTNVPFRVTSVGTLARRYQPSTPTSTGVRRDGRRRLAWVEFKRTTVRRRSSEYRWGLRALRDGPARR